MAVYFCLKVYDMLINTPFHMQYWCAIMNMRNTAEVSQQKGVIWLIEEPTETVVSVSCQAEVGR